MAIRGGRGIIAAAFLFLVAALQLFVFSRGENVQGPWFFFGTDTVYHDAIVQTWIQQQLQRDPTSIPLWMEGLQGGLPTLGAFLWTPFAPGVLPFAFLPFPAAQKLAWLLAIWIGGCGAYALGRSLRLSYGARVFSAVAWMLCGHVVTLIYAGHFQKVMALGWMPWCIAGAVMMTSLNATAQRARGLAMTAIALGLTLLSGHPQIFYISAALVCAWMLWSFFARPRLRPHFARSIVVTIAALALGLAVGGAQLIPGLEMSAVSNRGGGLDFAEATKTSYPPEELIEYVVPRLRGTTVRGDDHFYTGRWHERLVSDYAGKLVVLLAVAGIVGSRRIRQSLFWLAVIGISLLVGLGKFTPFYKLCFLYVPGFSTFRSPGTFMAAAALGIAMLSGYGCDAILHGLRTRWTRTGTRLAYMAALLITIGDQAWANRFFLIHESWSNYYGGYLAPNELDLWLSEHGLTEETHNELREFRFRQILAGGSALNGYHPIYFSAKGRYDALRNEDYRRWLAMWGLSHVIVDISTQVVPPDKDVVSIPSQACKIIKLSPTRAEVFAREAGPDSTYRWSTRTPNRQTLLVDGAGGLLRVPGMRTEGHTVTVDGAIAEVFHEPTIATELKVTAGPHRIEWYYAPASYRVGLFVSAFAMGIVATLLAFAARYRAPMYLRLREESAPNPHYGRALSYRDLKVT